MNINKNQQISINFYLLINLLIIFTIILPFNALSQIKLVNLEDNPVIKKYKKTHTIKIEKNKSATDTIDIPFFDDFSTSSVYPDSSLWLDNYVFVNSSYALNPPSIGVATFDAINFDGSIYSHASTSSFIADSLTSKPINLNYPGNTTIFLSFFYQPQGLGDRPEPSDSLILQFYSPITASWHPIWRAEYHYEDSLVSETHHYNNTQLDWKPDSLPDKVFKHVILPVADSIYLQNGFQFSFINYASLSSNIIPSRQGNADHWHIDYVYLDTARSYYDTIYRDVAFIYPTQSLLNSYEAIPWAHIEDVESSELQINITITYKNNDSIIRHYDRFFEIIDLYNGDITNYDGGAWDSNPNETIIKQYNFSDYVFPANPTDSALFEVISYLKISEDFDAHQNDTVRYYQKFYNYYAYDDGIAENGLGIDGEGTQNAMLAYKFHTYKNDTLQAVQMYFNQTLNNSSQKYFYLYVWDDNNGEPGDTLYTQIGEKPTYEDSLNKFHTYIIDETLIVSGTFYVGWKQTTEDFLNVGFDKNRNAQDKIFFNVYGYWDTIPFQGALMIRPVFGKQLPASIGSTPPGSQKQDLFTIYPNPADDIIFLSPDIALAKSAKKINISIYDSYGKPVYSSKLPSSQEGLGEVKIDLSNFSEGIYFLRIRDFNNFSSSKKFVIIR